MTNQELFDRVKAHLTAQGAASFNEESTMCMYRDSKGRSCAIGCLIPEEAYRVEFEGIGLKSHKKPLVDQIMSAAGIEPDQLDLACGLQIAHDRCTRLQPRRFARQLARELGTVAKKFDLIP